MNGATCQAGAECCLFDNQRDIRDVQFCMTDAQKNGYWTGIYVDDELTYWKWTCKKPPPPDDNTDPEPTPEPEPEPQPLPEPLPPKKECAVVLPAYSNYEDKTMEWILWTIYLSGSLPILGYIVILPVGIPVYTWFFINAFLVMGQGTDDEWMAGPFMSGVVMGPLIFTLHLLTAWIPLVSIATSFGLGYWANLDYY